MPSESTSSVGAMLRSAREQQGLSVNDVAERTRIRSTLIREIEDDNFFGCGDTFSARGHVRSLAVTVGLDPSVALAEFDAAHSATVPEAVTEWLPVYNPGKGKAAARAAEPAHTTPPVVAPPPPTGPAGGTRVAPEVVQPHHVTRPSRSSPGWKFATLAAALVVALLGTASYLIWHAQGPKQPAKAAPLPTLSLSPAPTPSTSPSPSPNGVNVQIEATTGTSYIKVTNSGGTVLYEGEMQAGDVKEFRDPQELSVRFGNSSVVRVTVNGVSKGTPTCGAIVCSETYRPV